MYSNDTAYEPHHTAYAASATPAQGSLPSHDGTGMTDSLAARKRDMTQRCTAAAQRAKRPLLFGLTTSLALQMVPLPKTKDLKAESLHLTAKNRAKRIRLSGESFQTHVWSHFDQASLTRINQYVYALGLFDTWAQMAPYVSLESLVVLGDAIITAAAKRSGNANDVYRQFRSYAMDLPQFIGKSACRMALPLIRPHSASPMESTSRLALQSHGVSEVQLNYAVPGMTFKSGAPMELDMAWPEQSVAVEYDGDHHRTDKTQWRRDQEKRERLRAHGWIIFTVNASNLSSPQARAEFAFNVARQLALRGAVFDFSVVAMPLERLSKAMKTGKSRGESPMPQKHDN